mmetsp:Transcript_18355/g.27123  ORF Transcript_18355/g.27123 Transcript_18355/m.27123 type:complete len:98 (-) Transcript_18355:15-308(-)
MKLLCEDISKLFNVFHEHLVSAIKNASSNEGTVNAADSLHFEENLHQFCAFHNRFRNELFLLFDEVQMALEMWGLDTFTELLTLPDELAFTKESKPI